MKLNIGQDKMKTKKQIQQNIESNNEDNDNCKLTYKEFHDRDIVLQAQLEMIEGFNKEFDKFEKENTKVLKTEDIIKKKIIIADYIKWDDLKELKQKING